MKFMRFLQPSRGTIVAIAIIAMVIPLGYSLADRFLRDVSAVPAPFLERPAAKYEKCVRDTEYMRFHHMELLRQIREEVIREGRRGQIGLNTCRECHTNRSTFCNRCHEAVSLNVDCFGCHYYPESPSELVAMKR
jgi:hypothetical protein